MPHKITLRYRDALYDATVADLRDGLPAMLPVLDLSRFPFARLLRAATRPRCHCWTASAGAVPRHNRPFELMLPDSQLLHALHRINGAGAGPVSNIHASAA
jgi:hypothetical protein